MNLITALITAIKTIINEPSLSPKEKFITAITSNIIINWSLNELKRKYIQGFLSSLITTFGPYYLSLFDASLLDKPSLFEFR